MQKDLLWPIIKLIIAVAALVAIFTFLILYDAEAATLPAQSDWVDQGVVLEDAEVWGFSPKVTFNNGVFSMDYIVAELPRRATDNGPRYRELRNATSTDAVNWTKNGTILTHVSFASGADTGESGVFTVAPCHVQGQFERLVGVMHEQAPEDVFDDIKLMPEPLTMVAAHDDPNWFGGDEIDPVACYEEQGEVYMIYACNGDGCWAGNDGGPWAKAWAKGSSIQTILPPATVMTIHNSRDNRGTVSVVDSWMFENDALDQQVKVWSFDRTNPRNRTLIDTWVFPGCVSMDFLEDAGKWWAFCQTTDHKVKLFTAFQAPPPPTPTPLPTPTQTPVPACTKTLQWTEGGIPKSFVFTADACVWSVVP